MKENYDPERPLNWLVAIQRAALFAAGLVIAIAIALVLLIFGNLYQ